MLYVFCGENMPKLLKHLAYSYKKRNGEQVPHYKYVIVVPDQARKQANWDDGEELEFEVSGETLILRPKRDSPNRGHAKRGK